MLTPTPITIPHIAWFRPCQPKILVVSDLSFSPTSQFGLSTFVDVLKSSRIKFMIPKIVTAHTGGDPDADIPGFSFTSSSLNISEYDVLFIFGFNPGSHIPASQIEIISKFMQDGGGVFATGDHATLGRRLCGGIPRVRHMRYWESGEVPSAGGPDRLTTNLPSVNNVYEFADQSDLIPQRLYPKYYGNASDSYPHAILQHPTEKIIEVFPDHPHEGECHVPSTTAEINDSFSVTGSNFDDFPINAMTGQRQLPEIIAKSMSAGGGIATHGKAPVVPREFGAICTFDGYEVDVGRVVTDATWHHFVNVNLIPMGSNTGLRGTDPTPPDAYERITVYYKNLAEWLMPKNRRMCSILHILTDAIHRFPLAEIIPTIDLDDTGSETDYLEKLVEIGIAFEETNRGIMTPSMHEEIKKALLENVSPDLANFMKSDFIERRYKNFKAYSPMIQSRLISADILGRAVVGAAVEEIYDLTKDEGATVETIKKLGGIEKLASRLEKRTHKTTKLFYEVSASQRRMATRVMRQAFLDKEK